MLVKCKKYAFQGFEWSDGYQACVDIDECSAGSAVCGENKVCTAVHCGVTCAQPHDATLKKGPRETVETFFREKMSSSSGHQPLTIARGRRGKYPSQREHRQLHGEVGDR